MLCLFNAASLSLHRFSVCLSVFPRLRLCPPASPPPLAFLPPMEAGSMYHTSLCESLRGACQASRPPHRHVNSCSAHRYAQGEPPECGCFVRAQRGDYKLADPVFSIMECSLQNLDRGLSQRIITVDMCVLAWVYLAAFLSRVAYTCWPGGLHTQIKCTRTRTLTGPLAVALIFISHWLSDILSLCLSRRLHRRCDCGITGSQTPQTFAAKCRLFSSTPSRSPLLEYESLAGFG